MEANARSEITGLSGADRRRIKAAQMQASDQITILEQGKASNGSDFYSYRYLATEGFLPGYNFPRLPLYAFIPGEGKTGSFLQRARFLAISEFGPRSLIYHEGRAYRVMKAKLPPEVRTGDGVGTRHQRHFHLLELWRLSRRRGRALPRLQHTDGRRGAGAEDAQDRQC